MYSYNRIYAQKSEVNILLCQKYENKIREARIHREINDDEFN